MTGAYVNGLFGRIEGAAGGEACHITNYLYYYLPPTFRLPLTPLRQHLSVLSRHFLYKNYYEILSKLTYDILK